MTKPLLGAKELATRISKEVENCLPTQFERSAARSLLHAKIEAIINESGYQGSHPASSRQVTLLLADIRGFTSLAETYSAMMVVDLLNRYFSIMTKVIVQYSGTIDKLMGDSIMVLFGAPDAKPDDIERAIACGIAMQQAMSEFNHQNSALGFPELYMGIGINTGEVVAGPIGSEHYREYTVIGDEVNLASRIEAQSLRGQILISESTYQSVQNFVLVGQPNRVQVKGRRKPLCLYELLGTSRPRTMTVPKREVRKSPRVQISIPCFFQIVDDKQVCSQPCRAEVLDIGYYGLLILSPVPLEPLSEIKIEISLELLASNTTDVYARIINSLSVGTGFQCSLEFSSMNMSGQRTIKRFVDNLICQP